MQAIETRSFQQPCCHRVFEHFGDGYEEAEAVLACTFFLGFGFCDALNGAGLLVLLVGYLGMKMGVGVHECYLHL